MKSKVKDELLNSSSSDESGSEDDEEAWKLTDEVEKEFFKTLSHIKSKDPKIYKKNVEFFKDVPIPDQKPKDKTKTAPLTLREYERKIVVEKGGELSDEEPPSNSFAEVSYVEEQRALKNSLKNLLQSDSEYESESEWGGLFKKRSKSKTETEKEEEDYKEWLKGQKSEAPDKKVAKEMKPLRDFWTDPNLKEDDQFLRDYVLNKRFLEADDKEDANKFDESESEDDNQLDKNCIRRSEEQDLEYIKRYPRAMDNTVRRKDDSRKRKREEIKERKQKEKQKKKAEIRQKQKSKKMEIEQKLEELKQLTGNDKLAFDNVLDKDFDIDEHEKAMQRLFNDEFYSQNDPNFNPNDREDFEGDWADVKEEIEEDYEGLNENIEPQCEDPDFNMDCDYDPAAAENTKQKSSRSRRRKDKHRKNTVSEVVKREKPVFDPTQHQSYQEYLDQYYAIDCEDFIGDLPCRFKYKRTIPNSYGLTVEEILAADPKELERWCSIKRITQLKPSYKEKGDAISYKRRAANEALKRKILPSLYKTPEEDTVVGEVKTEDTNQTDSENMVNSSDNKKEKPSNNNKNDLRKKRKSVASEMIVPPNKRRKTTPEQGKSQRYNKNKNQEMQSKNMKKNKNKIVNRSISNENTSLLGMSDARLQAYGIKPKKFRNKLKYNGVEGDKNKPGNKNNRNKKKTKEIRNSVDQSNKLSNEKNKVKHKRSNKKAKGWTVSNTS